MKPWAELRSDDTNKLIAELVEYKKECYPKNLRRIVAAEMSPEGNVCVHWTEPEKIIIAEFGSTSSKASSTTAKRGRPIADKLVKKMNTYVRGQVIDLKAVMIGRGNAEELQRTVATREDLAGFHPAHAIYVYAQNQVSAMSEQLRGAQRDGSVRKAHLQGRRRVHAERAALELSDGVVFHLLGVVRCLRRVG